MVGPLPCSGGRTAVQSAGEELGDQVVGVSEADGVTA